MTTYPQVRAISHNVQELDALWHLSCSWWHSRLQSHLAHPASQCSRALLAEIQRETWLAKQQTRAMQRLSRDTSVLIPIIPQRPRNI
jgi:hypothetical protein